MTRLSDTQTLILSAAGQRSDGNLLPLPGSLRGGAAAKVVTALLSRGLAKEEITDDMRTADSALNMIWRNTDEGRAVLLRITPAGLAALGIEADSAPERGPAAEGGAEAGTDSSAADGAPEARTAAPTRKTREGTKQAQLIAMLRRAEGATIDEIVAATGWRRHTVRGAFAGALKKRLGLTVTSDKEEGRGRVYRL
jgi:hypothetical protein